MVHLTPMSEVGYTSLLFIYLILTRSQLFTFMSDERQDVRLLAVQSAASLSATSEMKVHFKANEYEGIKQLMALCSDNPVMSLTSLLCARETEL